MCLRHTSVEVPGFETRCCLLTTGPLCHRCAQTCLRAECTVITAILAIQQNEKFGRVREFYAG